MKGKWLAALLAAVLCMGLAACNPERKSATMTIDDVTVLYQERATIEPVFSSGKEEGEVTYAFDGENIRIQGNVVTGLKGNTETQVTAKCGEMETTFSVKVVFANPFGKNAYTEEFDDVFAAKDDGVFEKTSADYGEAYYYAGDAALAGAKYVLAGKLEMSSPAEGAEAVVLVKESQTKLVRFGLKYEAEGEYTLYSDYKNGGEFEGYTKLKSLAAGTCNFSVMAYDGAAYFYCENVYVGKVDIDLGNSHVGIGGEKSTLVLTRLRSFTDDAKLNEYLEQASIVFGPHAFGGAIADNNVFAPTENEGEYVKAGTGYGQTYYYHDGLPVAGSAYTVEFTVKAENPGTGLVQSTFMISKDDENMVRFAMEYDQVQKKWYIFTDAKREGSFGNWVRLKTLDTNTAKIKIVYDNGNCSLYVDGTLLKSLEEKGLGETHIGFGGEKCKITLSGFTASVTA